MYIGLAGDPEHPRLVELDAVGMPVAPEESVSQDELAIEVARREREGPRWVWDSTATRYPALLAAGVRVARCVDLRLQHAIVRQSAFTAASRLATADDGPWDEPATPTAPEATRPYQDTLFATDEPRAELDIAAELRAQLDAVATSSDPSRLRLLLAGESAGALIAAEIRHAGMPWDVERHDAVLTENLGARPALGGRPARMAELVEQLREALDAPRLNPDSQPHLLAALRRAGIDVQSTSRWELREHTHPAIEPLLRYKKLARLNSANGWAWAEQWVHGGRFRPEYVVGGVVTGRWATSGGGALQLPAEVRRAVVADPGWRLVVADAAQLEPRVLAALARDERMARAGQGADMYQGMVDSGALPTRQAAKVGMLSAMYGGTTGSGAEALPLLRRAFPTALGFVEAAAAAGERGERVSTHLGRTSPLPDAAWHATQRAASELGADAAAERRARSQARAWGRFTRNFVVQGTAAEWALAWLASVRRRLAELPDAGPPGQAPPPFSRSAHLVYFLHDEIMVHTPAQLADEVVRATHEAATEAGRLLFGNYPVAFPITVSIVESYDQAK